MFFIMGISSGQKQLMFNQMMICDRCGKYGRYEVFMTYTVLSLFFIPVFKWGKQYYVKSTCCNATYRLDSEIGKRIARGEELEIGPNDLAYVSGGSHSNWQNQDYGYGQIESQVKTCENCGYETEEDFEFCPKCGRKF